MQADWRLVEAVAKAALAARTTQLGRGGFSGLAAALAAVAPRASALTPEQERAMSAWRAKKDAL
eukprot:581446-Prymnesium_polylepis.1